MYLHRPESGWCNFALLPALHLLLGDGVVGGEVALAPTLQGSPVLIENVSKTPPDTFPAPTQKHE